MSIDISQFYKIFFDEAAEHLSTMESLLLALDVTDPGAEELNAVFRAAHSIKGGSSTFGFDDMTAVTHVLESLLDRLRKQEMKLTDAMVNVFLEAGDVIRMQLDAHRGEGAVDQDVVRAVCGKLERLAGGSAPVARAMPHGVTATAQGGIAREPLPAAAEEADQGYGLFAAVSDAATQPAGPGYGFFADEPPPVAAQQDRADAAQGYGFFEELAPVAVPVPRTAHRSGDDEEGQVTELRRASDQAAGADTSIRVHVEKLDQLINLVGELVITQAMLAQSAASADSALYEKLKSGLHQLERNTRDLQEVV
ncbi:MAG: chemotaxis protein CheA, partial [Gallionella sp.]|nr:chemotaxis protein CheA [Gallionella sp.]